MSSFKSGLRAIESLYENHLTAIKGINFTPREIDIISCILHNRGEKKIASLFLISPRTISAHVYNIMNKIGCNSKDQIIDFIETSGKIGIIKEYYTHILIKAHFEKFLSKISATINRSSIKCFCNFEHAIEIDKKLHQSIQKHLKLANIEIDTDKNLPQTPDNIFVIKAINEGTYYQDMVLAISNIIKSNELNKLIDEFNELYQQIIDGQKENTIVIHKVNKYNNLLKLTGVIFFGIVLLSFCIYYYTFFKTEAAQKDINNKPDIIYQLETFLDSIKKEEFTANNASKDQSKSNQSLIKRVEQILYYQNILEVQKYFDKADMDSKFLLDYLYNLHSLASYYMYNMHDGKKARDILLYAKDLVEGYLNKRSVVRINFDNISSDELFAELDVIKDLPEIYTRITYATGRTYIYHGGAKNGIKYFEISKYLGRKLGLFEGYLSEVSGLLAIEKKDLKESLQTNDKRSIKDKINLMIEKYNLLKNDHHIYILDFIPNSKDQKTTIPSKHLYNIFTNQTRIIECYTDLLFIADEKSERKNILNNISWILRNNFIGEDQDKIQDNKKGIKYIIDKIPLRRLASLYNVLGDIFLILYKVQESGAILSQPIFDVQIIDEVLNSYSYTANLEIAFKLFDKARSISRNTDFTKADAYEGLAKVYQEQLNNLNLTIEEKKDLMRKIKETLDKKLQINSNLGRR